MLDHFDMETDRGTGVAAREQILYEGHEDYAKVVCRYPLARKSALEDLLDHGETQNMLCFQGAAMLPPAPIPRQMQTKI